MHNISRDVQRFRNIIKGKIKEDLKKYMSSDEIVARQGKDFVSIPIPQIELPRFKFNDAEKSGVGQGDAEAGDNPGEEKHSNLLELEVSIEELADILGSQLQLPKILPKGKKDVAESIRYSSLRRKGPESLKSFKYTFKEALKRQIGSGTYDFEDPIVVPISDDKRYKVSVPSFRPHNQAVIFYMMDVSGSMDEQKKLLARLVSFWIDTWLRRNYKYLEYKYLVHNITAWEVLKDEFFRIREGGGTYIHSIYSLSKKVILEKYPPNDWNIYLFHFSDGDDLSELTSEKAIRVIKELLPFVNQLAYCQVLDTGKFIKTFNDKLKYYPNVVSSQVESKEDVYEAIKTFFSKGN